LTEKFDFYDILGIFVPGVLALCLLVIAFPDIVTLAPNVAFPEAFLVLALTAAALFLGQLIQSLSSLLEPLLNWTWGGSASNRALTTGLGDRYLPRETGKRIREKLSGRVGSGASNRSLFLFAMQLAETSTNPRVGKFNGLYAYHRALCILMLVATILGLGSMKWGGAAFWPTSTKTTVLSVEILLLVLTWYRAKQRGFYYVREVLFSAERTIDGIPAAPATAPVAP
jgi:hypothetical protein